MSTPTERRAWLALAVLCLPVLLISMDVSILFFAVPDIARTLRPTGTELLWIFDVYGFVLAGLLIPMGAVADRFGRRRVMLLGAAAFGIASALTAWSPSPAWLIAARVLLGIGGATLMPSTLALIRSVFDDTAARAKAIGIWSAVMAGGVSLGPIVAGLLLDHFWWGSVFLVNLPVLAVFLVVGPLLLPETANPAARIDPASAVLALAAILPVIHAIKDVAAHGWGAGPLAWAAAGVTSGALFMWRQGVVASPMVDLTLFRHRGFPGALLVQVIGMFGVMGNAVLLTQYLQSVLGLTALAAALWSLAPSVLVGAAAPGAAVLAGRVGRPRVMAGAFVLAAVGFLTLRLTEVGSSVWVAIAGATPVAVGLVVVATLVTEYAVGVAPAERTGSVAALTETASELGGALGMAILGSVLAGAYRGITGTALPPGLPTAEARAAYVDAMHVTDLVAAAVLLAGALVAVLMMPRTVSVPAGSVEASQELEAARTAPTTRGET